MISSLHCMRISTSLPNFVSWLTLVLIRLLISVLFIEEFVSFGYFIISLSLGWWFSYPVIILYVCLVFKYLLWQICFAYFLICQPKNEWPLFEFILHSFPSQIPRDNMLIWDCNVFSVFRLLRTICPSYLILVIVYIAYHWKMQRF